MKIVVIGGTGLIGSKTVAILRQCGNEVVAALPQSGTKTITSEGLKKVMAGAQVAIDLANSPSSDDKAVLEFFESSGRNLLAAELEAGVRHHVALSIVGIDRSPEIGYFRAKMAQEKLIETSGIPYTTIRSTQFLEFLGSIADAGADRNTVRISPGLFQPIAADDAEGSAVVGRAALGHSYCMTQRSAADGTGKAGAVLITRPEPGASDTAARVAAIGLLPIVAPLLDIRPLPIRLPPERIAAVVLASGNAVDALAALCRSLPMLTVGAATARRAGQAGFTNLASADGDAVALAALVRARVRPSDGTLLLAAGQGQSVTLAADLRASGYRVARRVAYAAMPVPHLPDQARAALEDHRTRTVLLFSAETARHFLRLVRQAGLLGALADREAITIGPRAAMALRQVPWARIRVAAKPTQDDMLALLQ